VRNIFAYANANGAFIIVELHEDVQDIRMKMLDIKDRVDQIDSFPPEVEKPIISEMVVRDQVINLAIYGEVMERTLKETASEFRGELLAKENISQVELTGVRDYEISIQLSREALERYDLSLPEVTAIVSRNCMDVPAGTLKTDQEELRLWTIGQRYTARDFEELVLIARPDGTLIKLGNVAEVRDGFEENFKSGRFQGQPAAMLEIYKTPKQDINTVAETIREYVAGKKAALPDTLHCSIWADHSREVAGRIDMLVDNGLLGMVLVVIVLTLFLDFGVSLFVALGIPVSFAGALVVMHFTGQTLNMISLFGLIMVTGIIVDDAIVIADSFRISRSEGDAPQLAAVNGSSRMFLPVTASSGTTILAFIPLFFVVGIMGKFIAALPVVVISAIVFSSIEAFGILPSHLRHCMRSTDRPSRWRNQVRDRVERWIDHLRDGYYHPFARKALRVRWITVCASVGLLLLTGGLVIGGRPAFTLLPDIDSDLLRARIRFPQGVPVSRTQEAARKLEAAALRLNNRKLLEHTGEGELVKRTFSVIGEWSGYVEKQGSNLCEVMIELLPAEQRKLDSDVVLREWSKQMGTVPEALTVTYGRMEKSPSSKAIEVSLLGHDLEKLEQAAEEGCDELGKFAGVHEIGHDLLPGKREVRVKLKPLARTLGVTLDRLAGELRNGFYGGEAVRVQRGGDEIRVQVRLLEEDRKTISDIENLRVKGIGGQEIPFRELATYEIERGYSHIRRENGYRCVRIQANVDERKANAEEIVTDLEKSFLNALPAHYPGVRYRIAGQHAQVVESLQSLFGGFAVALVGIYAILAAMLVSYYQPVVIMVAIPLGFMGAILGHLVTGYDLNIMSVFGMVALSGVVVNDSLVLLDQVNYNIRNGKGLFQSALEAGEVRFRAVMLTTITTIAGLTPLMLERSTQAQWLIPMAVTLTFGLAFATVLTLVVVPALFLTSMDVQRVATWLWRGGEFPSAEAVTGD